MRREGILPILLLCSGLCQAQRVVKKVVVSEYRCWYYMSDSTIWGFNNGSTHPVQWAPPTGRKWCFPQGGFNFLNILDDQGYLWQSHTFNIDITTNTYRVDTDTTGAAFSGNIFLDSYSTANLVIRADSSVWYGGTDVYSLFYSGGNVVTSAGSVMKFTQLSPAGMKFKKTVCGYGGIFGLTTAGQVYKWSNGGSRTPTLLSTPRPAIDIFCSANDFQGALVPKATGSQTMGYPFVMGNNPSMYGGSTNLSSLTDVSATWGLTQPIKEISVDWNTIHYIDSSGRLWGCGYNIFGEVGNGQEFVNKYTYVTYPAYNWDLNNFENPTGVPAQIGSKTDWKHIWSTTWFGFYKCAADNNDSIYSWGRNKASVLGNGYFTTSLVDQFNSNWGDVLQPTQVTPLSATAVIYDFTQPTFSAAPNQNIAVSSTTLTATGNSGMVISQSHPAANGVDTIGYPWVSYLWTKVSGPSCTITSPSSKSTTVTGLSTGTYVFQVLGTDTNTGQDTAKVQVIVSASSNPTSNAGPDQVITLPTTSASLSGSGTPVGPATITSYLWTKISGPGSTTITGNTTTTPTVSGLQQGVYVFNLHVTDSNSNTADDTVQVTVNPAINRIRIFIRRKIVAK